MYRRAGTRSLAAVNPSVNVTMGRKSLIGTVRVSDAMSNDLLLDRPRSKRLRAHFLQIHERQDVEQVSLRWCRSEFLDREPPIFDVCLDRRVLRRGECSDMPAVV